jgi:hypothetical protein
MTGVTVRDSRFSGGGGFAVSFAHVRGAVVERNDLTGYAEEFVHIEDRSRDVLVTDNTFSDPQDNRHEWYSYVLVINASTRITISGNRFEIGNWDRRFRCIYVGPGGSAFEAPTQVSITQNRADVRGPVPLVDTYGDAGVSVDG